MHDWGGNCLLCNCNSVTSFWKLATTVSWVFGVVVFRGFFTCFLQCSCVSLAVGSVCKLLFFLLFKYSFCIWHLQHGQSNLWVGTVPSEQTGRSGDRQKIIWSSQLKNAVVNLMKWHRFFFLLQFFFFLENLSQIPLQGSYQHNWQ